VTPRGLALLAVLTALLALVRPGSALAQVAPPKLVDENDVEEPAPPPPPVPPAQPPPAAGAGAAGSGASSSVQPIPSAASGALHPAAPTPPPVAPPPAEPARKIAPVQSSWTKLMDAWAERRRALHEGDPAGADAAQKALLAAQRDLGIENLYPLAVAEVRGVARALSSRLPAEALSRAEVAVTLAPDWPEAHLARARALLGSSSGGVGPAAGAVLDAVLAAFRDPQSVRALIGDAAAALLCGVAAACLLAIALLSLSRLRLALHDTRHLPLVGGAGVQVAFLALALLLTPVALGLGPLAVVAVALLLSWLYLSLSERLLCTAALLGLFALPWAAEQAGRLTVWTGTPADEVYRIEHGALSDEEAAAAVKALGPETPAPVVAALGRHYKRRGELATALQLYRKAAEADPHAPELQVNIGNVLFLQENLEGARAAYLAAQDRAEGDLVTRGAAAYDLSKLFVRTSEMDKSSAARANAEQMAGAFLAAHGSDEDFSANHYLVDVPVPPAKILALAAADPAPAALRGAVQAALVGGGVGRLWPWLGGGLVALLWLLALVGARLDPARSCYRCGRPVCRRCDGATGAACGQCVNVFEKKGVVDARDQRRKEQQVRQHRLWVKRLARALALLLGGGGHLVIGAPIRGLLFTAAIACCAFVVVLWPGVTPPPFPTALVLPVKLATALPLGLAIWILAVRDLFRRTEA
jgi:tetratricopeptide (TPR) repeat protein